MEYRTKFAEDFRRIARDALRGKWVIAVIAGVIASLLSGAEGSGPQINFQLNQGDFNLGLDIAGQPIFSTDGRVGPVVGGLLAGGIIYVFLLLIVLAAVYYILGSVIEVGYSRFNLELVDYRQQSIDNLFGYFSFWKNAALTRFFKSLHILVGTLLLIVPGIIATYSYAMTGYILAERPELEPRDALAASKAMMDGNRWRLFCLEISFIGWDLLCALTLGIGNLALRPYKEAAKAAFYREISGAERQQTASEPWEN